MATRTYCDQCGSTCREPNKFMFGPFEPYAGQGAKDYFLPGSPSVSVTLTQIGQPKKQLRTVVIDLCDTCAPVWHKRVEALTKASDV